MRVVCAPKTAEPTAFRAPHVQTAHYGGIMKTMRETWTDERLEDLSDGLIDFRRETREEFAAVRGEMKDEFRAVRREMKEGFRSMHDRFDALQGTLGTLQRVLIQVAGGILAAFGAALIGLIATQL
jgi:hypothetical protein